MSYLSEYDWIDHQDKVSILRQLALPDGSPIPEAVQQEYLLRYQMKHRAGAPGPLGESEVREILFRNNVLPQIQEHAPQTQHNWDIVNIGDRILVSIPNFPPYYGSFRGGVEAGTIAVQPEAGGQVLEVKMAHARPAPNSGPGYLNQQPANQINSQPEGSGEDFFEAMSNESPDQQQFQPPQFDSTQAVVQTQASPLPQHFAAQQGQQVPQMAQQAAAPAAVSHNGAAPIQRAVWEQVPQGTEVVVNAGGIGKDGRFHSTVNGQVFVVLEGNEIPMAFAPDQVAVNPM